MTKSELRVVIDTNIVMSAAMFEDSVPFQALFFVAREGRILLSQETEEELKEVIRRKKFDKYVPEEERLEFLGRLLEDTELVRVTEQIHECRDPKDNKFLELAVSGHASHIITGDADLLVMNPFRGIAIVTAKEFLASVADNG
jgi:uncharacterized protein